MAVSKYHSSVLWLSASTIRVCYGCQQVPFDFEHVPRHCERAVKHLTRML